MNKEAQEKEMSWIDQRQEEAKNALFVLALSLVIGVFILITIGCSKEKQRAHCEQSCLPQGYSFYYAQGLCSCDKGEK